MSETPDRTTAMCIFQMQESAKALAIQLAQARSERDEAIKALDYLLAVVGLTPIAGNMDALQEAVNLGLTVLRILRKEEARR